jgi:hypothetical protein
MQFDGLEAGLWLEVSKGRRLSRVDLGPAILALVALFCASNALAAPSYTIQEIGLTGDGYTYVDSGGLYQDGAVEGLNDNGQAIGLSDRVNSIGEGIGFDTWFFNGSSTEQIGLTGGVYGYYSYGGDPAYGTYQSSYVYGINDAGDAFGLTERYSSTGGNLGADSWFFNGTSTQQIGLTGTNYSYTTSGGVYQGSRAESYFAGSFNEAGQLVGFSERYNSSGTYLGTDAWLFNGISTQQIGLTDSQHSYAVSGGIYRTGDARGLNSSGEVIGVSERYGSAGTDLGTDAWIFSGTSTQQIGLTGANYTYSAPSGNYQISDPMLLNNAGQVAGISSRFTSSGVSLGSDSWLYNGTSSRSIGLTGTNYSYAATGGTYQSSSPLVMNTAGQVVGYSDRYSSTGATLGSDSWFFNGTSTQAIGLTGGIYGYSVPGGTYQFGSYDEAALNNAGQVVGTSTRFSSSGAVLGDDTWFFNGTTSQQIGLTGANYSYATTGGTYENSNFTQLNNAGQAIGFSNRFDPTGTSLGSDGWFFDEALDKTFLLQFSVDSANDYSFTDPEILTDSGIVLGDYVLYDGSVDVGTDLFYWSEANGFKDLGALIGGDLSDQGWQELADTIETSGLSPQDGLSPMYIDGDGLITGQTSGNSYFVLTAEVPEPTCLALIPFGALILKRYRRTRLAV